MSRYQVIVQLAGHAVDTKFCVTAPGPFTALEVVRSWLRAMHGSANMYGWRVRRPPVGEVLEGRDLDAVIA